MADKLVFKPAVLANSATAQDAGIVVRYVDNGDGTWSEKPAGSGGITTTVSVNAVTSITAGGTAQDLFAANTSRKGWWIQNISVGDLWIRDDGAAAAADTPSFKLAAGGYFECPANGASGTKISIFGATTGQKFAARQW
jgi:hypothetical protein